MEVTIEFMEAGFFFNKEIYIKYLTDKAEKENNIEIKNGYRKMVEYAVKTLEELDDMIRIINE